MTQINCLAMYALHSWAIIKCVCLLLLIILYIMRPIGFDFELQYNITKMIQLLSHNAVVNGVGGWGGAME